MKRGFDPFGINGESVHRCTRAGALPQALVQGNCEDQRPIAALINPFAIPGIIPSTRFTGRWWVSLGKRLKIALPRRWTAT